jgi:1,4-dihydroxy-2-naphthoate octaprenyltransferase
MAEATARPGLAPARPVVWWRALRAYSFPASIVPCVVGAAAVPALGARATWVFVPLVLAGGIALHVLANLVNDAVDFRRGVDCAGARGGSGVLVAGWLSARQVWGGAAVALLVAGLAGAPLVAARGWPFAAIGLAGAAGAYAYTGPPLQLKYRALGEVWVFAMMGTLMVAGAAYALAGAFPCGIWLASAPVGFLVAAILAANNQRDLEEDRRHDIHTVAILLGPSGARAVTLGLIAGAYLAVAALWVGGVLRWPVLLALATAPLAWPVARDVAAAGRGRPMAAGVVERVAALHLVFGLAYALGLALSS